MRAAEEEVEKCTLILTTVAAAAVGAAEVAEDAGKLELVAAAGSDTEYQQGDRRCDL